LPNLTPGFYVVSSVYFNVSMSDLSDGWISTRSSLSFLCLYFTFFKKCFYHTVTNFSFLFCHFDILGMFMASLINVVSSIHLKRNFSCFVFLFLFRSCFLMCYARTNEDHPFWLFFGIISNNLDRTNLIEPIWQKCINSKLQKFLFAKHKNKKTW